MTKAYTIEFVKDIARSKGGICLSESYKNNREKLEFQCSEGHIFNKNLDKVLSEKQWCPKCIGSTLKYD